MRKGMRDERGFTLLEVVVVTLILAVLVAIVTATYYQSSDRAVEMADRANLRVIRSALEQYRAASLTASYPAELDELYPAFIRSRNSLRIPGTGATYQYDPSLGVVRNPDFPDR
jgi:prepilin-type N-terminal cleavage/methylation domain-containing protein